MESNKKFNVGQAEEGPNFENPINYRTEEWRREKLDSCRRVVEEALSEVVETINDDFTIKFEERYASDIEKAYIILIDATSSKVDDLEMCWHPLENTFERWAVLVKKSYQGEGIGTKIEHATEKIARSLGADALVISSIIDTSLGYWRNHPDFELDEKTHKATKRLK